MRFIFGSFYTILVGIIWFYSYCEFFPITFSIGYYCVQKSLIFICEYFIFWTYLILRFNDLLRIILDFLYMWSFCQAQNCLTFLTSSVFFHSFPLLSSPLWVILVALEKVRIPPNLVNWFSNFYNQRFIPFWSYQYLV